MMLLTVLNAKIGWKRVLWLLIPAVVPLTFPYWYGWLNPASMETFRCIVPDAQ